MRIAIVADDEARHARFPILNRPCDEGEVLLVDGAGRHEAPPFGGSRTVRNASVAVRWLTEGMRLHHITNPLLALAIAIAPAFAENQPDRQAPLRIVVSVPAGGVSDRVASPSGIATLSDLAPRHREGRLRILATSGAERSMLLPGVPTFREQGFETAQATGWHAVYGPAATPAQVIDRLSGAIVAALESPELRAKLVALGVEATGTTPEQLAAIMAADTAHWAPIIKAAGFNAPRQ